VDKQTLPAGITAEMIKNAKEKYGEDKIKYAELQTVDDGDEYLTVLVRRPDKSARNEFSKWVDKNPGKADDILVKNCLLSHKEQVLADEGLFSAAVDAIAQLIIIRKAKIKNL
jgi:hypothetical protein